MAKQCCQLDNDRDGNCKIHSAPGVLRVTPGTKPKWSRPRTVEIVKLPNECDVCRSSVTFLVMYRDPANPGPIIYPPKGGVIRTPTDSIHSCTDHVAEATAILLKRNNLIKEPDADA